MTWRREQYKMVSVKCMTLHEFGPSRAFSGRRICLSFRRDIGKVAFKGAGSRMRYTYGTENFLIFNLVNGKNTKRSRDIGKNNSGEI